MKHVTNFFILFALIALSGCGSASSSGGGSGVLDCAWVNGNNCWKTMVANATACLPDSTTNGTLSGDGRTCTYSGGRSVLFDSPLNPSATSSSQWKFTVNNSGQLCLRYEDLDHDGIKLTSAAGSFSETQSGSTLTVTCPDGSSFSTSNALALFNCPGGLFSLPGNFWSSTGSEVTFSVTGTQTGSTQIFDCKTGP